VGSRHVAAADLNQLGASLEGDLFKPGDAGWDAARQAWNLVAVQYPDAVALVSARMTSLRSFRSHVRTAWV
jgi:hypothetical protein